MKKMISALLIFAVVGFFGISYYQGNHKVSPNRVLGHAKISFEAKNVSDLINNSDLIVEAEIDSNPRDITYAGANFVETAIKPNKVYKGSNLVKGDQIYLLQTLIQEDPLVTAGEKRLLFLKKYSGAVTSNNSFVSVGLLQGNYKLKNGELEPQGTLPTTLSEDFKQYKTYEKMINKLQKEVK